MNGVGGRWQHQRSSRAARMLEPALLLLLHYRPAHGYNLLKELRRFCPHPKGSSVVYRALRDMEEKKWVTSTWDEERTQGPPRRIYSLTVLGDQALRQHTQQLQEVRVRIERLLGAYNQHMQEGKGEHHGNHDVVS
jgi:PadR family transcriptional regulator PadR